MSREASIAAARARKATAIAAVLERYDILAAEVSGIDDKGRRAAEAIAGVPVSSEETWDMVPTILAARRALRARLAALPADPFEVLR